MLLKSVWDRLKKNLNNREEKKEDRGCACGAAVGEEKDDHRHERGQQEEGIYGTGIQDRQIYDRERQTEKEKLEERIRKRIAEI